MTVGGSVDPGFTEVVQALLIYAKADGSPVRSPSDVTGQVTMSNGQMSGSVRVATLPSSAHEGSLWLEVTARDPSTGAQSSGVSPALTIDLAAPRITGTFLTALDTIRVEFSEGVVMPPGQVEKSIDWKVDGIVVPTPVEGEGDIRTLRIGVQKDEDATPSVSYFPTVVGGAHVDGAGNSLNADTFITTARDLVAPTRVPSVQSVAGQAPGELTSNIANPTVVLSGLRPGHVGQAWAESNGQGGFQPGDRLLGEAAAGDDGVATVATQALGQDKTYTIYGVARDRALCQPGVSSQECPNYRAASGSTTYRLDTATPAPVSAMVLDGALSVTFSEAIGPVGSASDWAVSAGGPVTGVSGSGKERTITTTGVVPAGATVTWNRPASGAYADAAGNAVDSFALQVIGPVHVKVGQFINRTTKALWTRISWTTIDRFASSNVDLHYTTAADPGTLRSVAAGTSNDGLYSWQAEALRGQRIRFAVTARDAGGKSATGYSGWIDLIPPDPVSVGAGQLINQTTKKLWVRINWKTSATYTSPTVDVWYSVESDPDNFKKVITGTENDGLHSWQAEALRGKRVRFAVTAYDSSGNPAYGYTDWIGLMPADAAFTVGAGQFVNNTTGQLWARINWTTPSHLNSSTVDIKYETAAEPGALNNVVAGTENDGLHSAQVEALRGQRVRFAVIARDSSGNPGTGYSDWIDLMPPPTTSETDPLQDPLQWLEVMLP